jgi:hypothetical protein
MLRPQREREVAEVKSAIATIREFLGDEVLIGEIYADFAADWECGDIDLDVIKTLKRAIEPMSKIMERFEPAKDDGGQQRTWFPRREARSLKNLLSYFGLKVSLRTPDVGRPNPGLDLIGLLADPPVSGDVIRYRLRR